jgi:stearoyl-CoA desaturase (delta-9 desaturase)
VNEATAPGPPVATVRERTSIPSRIVTMIAVLVPPLGVLSAVGLLWGVAVRPVDLILLVVLYTACGLGITVGYHRLFSHKAFATTPAVRGTLAVLGSMPVQGPVTQWVTDHRKHHALSDREGDPHSPHGHRDGVLGGLAGFLHAHMGWLVTTKGMERGRRYGRDLYDDPVIRRIDRLYMLWVALTLAIPFAVGYAVEPTLRGGLTGMVWGGLVRIFLFHHMTWSVNSICHTFGTRAFDTDDESRNNWVIAFPTFGEGWHNNHHAFPASAIHGLGRRQVDVSWWTIRGLERLGLAWNVKVPNAERIARRAARTPRRHAQA